jgi:uncharacterized 2Fe-2S/4Fe-4S cluster protein (DUF4445 family)
LTVRLVVSGRDEPVEANSGETLLDSLARTGVPVEATCAGQGRCARCRAIVRGPCNPVTVDERKLLTTEELESGWRLLCRTECVDAEGDVEILMPSVSHVPQPPESPSLRPIEVDSPVDTFRIALARPTIDDARSDLVRVEDSLGEGFSMDANCEDPAVIASLSRRLRDSSWRADLLLRDTSIVGARAPSAAGPTGVAVDVGTSKIAVYLVDMDTGERLDSTAIPNPQSAFGEDIISRVQRATEKSEDAAAMRRSAIEAINVTASGLAARNGLSSEDLCESVLVGNTVMHHLLFGLPVESLGRSPFAPATSLSMDTLSRGLGLESMPGAHSYLPALIAGFVGSDHVAALAATGLAGEEEPCLLIDVGTNTEVSLVAGGKVLCCSCASGPAFEGGGLSFGMRAGAGAIQSVSIERGLLSISTVDGTAPRGICGSGILDALVVMLRGGALDDTGRIIEGAAGVETVDGERVFRLVESPDEGWITVDQADVREIQKAKGAIRAGVEILLATAGVRHDELSKVVLAGSFGTCLAPAAAVEIAMLPPIDPAIAIGAGNAAGYGACMLLCSKKERVVSEELARAVEHVELAGHPDISVYFVASTCLSERAFSERLTRFKTR